MVNGRSKLTPRGNPAHNPRAPIARKAPTMDNLTHARQYALNGLRALNRARAVADRKTLSRWDRETETPTVESIQAMLRAADEMRAEADRAAQFLTSALLSLR